VYDIARLPYCQGLVVNQESGCSTLLEHCPSTLPLASPSGPSLAPQHTCTRVHVQVQYSPPDSCRNLPNKAANLQRAPFLHPQHTLSLQHSVFLGIGEFSHKRDFSNHAKLVALGLLGGCNTHISIIILSKSQKPGVCRVRFNRLSLFNSLYRAPIFGIDRIVAR